MRVTIKDIAERAGVSKTTVSFAFNEPSRLARQTRERVRTIAAEFGYSPDNFDHYSSPEGWYGIRGSKAIPKPLRRLECFCRIPGCRCFTANAPSKGAEKRPDLCSFSLFHRRLL
jgi:transcriptional regulator with XRE-family HTH domain